MTNVGGRVTAWSIVGTCLIVVSVGFLIFASAFPWWWQRASGRKVSIPHNGLWEICFKDGEGEAAPAHVQDELMKTYVGCNYVFDRKLRKIVSWYFTDWFTIVVMFVTLGLIFQPLAFILNLLYYLKVCSPHLEYVLLGVSALVSWTTGFICAIAIIIFGIKSDSDKYWIPNPESHHLSSSFGMCAVVPVLCWFAGMCHAVEFLRVKSIRDRNARIKVYERSNFGRY